MGLQQLPVMPLLWQPVCQRLLQQSSKPLWMRASLLHLLLLQLLQLLLLLLQLLLQPLL